ncbi:hypothetical protein AOQ84DRAFT_431347 [Glonium stellatum]|uniref:DUF6536 domain-containing protein n=1 Tax=Glonium stellatum TaxID=574774 RepID=A0A8E2JTR7_9PEZI|nr:hypothetical protein AOQ84DRAFT_431347 [Glonium stellatum]
MVVRRAPTSYRRLRDEDDVELKETTNSIPLHLLFNSAVFPNLQANQYSVLPATEDFLNGAAWNASGLIDVATNTSESIVKAAEQFRTNLMKHSNYKNMSTADCFHAYSNQYISEIGDALLIQEAVIWRSPDTWRPQWANHSGNYTWVRHSTSFPRPLNYDDELPFTSSPSVYPSNGWRCPSRSLTNCTASSAVEVPSPDVWAPYGSPVKYCLVEEVPERCELQLSFNIVTSVIICNIIKATCMWLTLWRHRKPGLVTLGDAIASFLDDPDPETEGRCLHSKELFQAEWQWERHHNREEITIDPEAFAPQRQRWGKASSKRRWFATYMLYIIAIIVASVFIKRSLQGMPSSFKGLWATGLGTLNGNNLLSMSTSLVGGVILANVPQAVLSYLYLCFNALYTCMLVAHEWARFFYERRTLRVTSPSSQQRSSYWLQLPYTYAVPLTVASGLLHWLASQSLFMVQITVVNDDGEPDPGLSISTCGYSPVAIILTTIVGSFIVLGGIGTALRRYPAGMPLASSCSAAISAACHPPSEDIDAAVLPVQWGVVDGGGKGEVGHCTFTSMRVTEPVPGKLYA